MKKTVIASLIGGLILFIWQFLSQAALDLHQVEHQYTPQQDTIINFLASQLKEGKYTVPLPKPNCTMEEAQKFMDETVGKPMATIDYKIKDDSSMIMNLVRGFLCNIVIIWIFISLLLKIDARSFKTILIASVSIGLIGFLNHSYTNYIWYHAPGVYMDLLDAVVGWGLVGLYLGKAYKNQ